jgi:hypothetical protein
MRRYVLATLSHGAWERGNMSRACGALHAPFSSVPREKRVGDQGSSRRAKGF